MARASEEVSYTFGPFRLEGRSGELLRHDTPVPVTPKVFELLLVLVRNHGKLMSKRELIEQLWPDTHVEEGSLTRAVAHLRSALSDDAAHPEYVETVPRRGYRFVAGVHEVDPRPASTNPSRFLLTVGHNRYPLSEGENLLGRGDDCTVSLKLASISRRHAVITIEDSRATIRDLRSKNGTFVRGRRIEAPSPLLPGDDLRIGSVKMTFTSPSADPSTVTDLYLDEKPAKGIR